MLLETRPERDNDSRERDNELDGCGKLSTEQSRCMAMNTCVDGVESMILDGEAMGAQWRWSSTHPSELNGDGLANHWETWCKCKVDTEVDTEM